MPVPLLADPRTTLLMGALALTHCATIRPANLHTATPTAPLPGELPTVVALQSNPEDTRWQETRADPMASVSVFQRATSAWSVRASQPVVSRFYPAQGLAISVDALGAASILVDQTGMLEGHAWLFAQRGQRFVLEHTRTGSLVRWRDETALAMAPATDAHASLRRYGAHGFLEPIPNDFIDDVPPRDRASLHGLAPSLAWRFSDNRDSATRTQDSHRVRLTGALVASGYDTFGAPWAVTEHDHGVWLTRVLDGQWITQALCPPSESPAQSQTDRTRTCSFEAITPHRDRFYVALTHRWTHPRQPSATSTTLYEVTADALAPIAHLPDAAHLALTTDDTGTVHLALALRDANSSAFSLGYAQIAPTPGLSPIAHIALERRAQSGRIEQPQSVFELIDQGWYARGPVVREGRVHTGPAGGHLVRRTSGTMLFRGRAQFQTACAFTGFSVIVTSPAGPAFTQRFELAMHTQALVLRGGLAPTGNEPLATLLASASFNAQIPHDYQVEVTEGDLVFSLDDAVIARRPVASASTLSLDLFAPSDSAAQVLHTTRPMPASCTTLDQAHAAMVWSSIEAR
ncbi:MAG: hypothetical protein Q8Q09_13700 [Deltaproteobacteria bacterium]|nr:hypothetical protein [Deltaproteobacteria bacterium]